MVLVGCTASSSKCLLGTYGLQGCVQQVCSKVPTIMVAHICVKHELLWLSYMHFGDCHAWQAPHKHVGNVDIRLQQYLSAKVDARLVVRQDRTKIPLSRWNRPDAKIPCPVALECGLHVGRCLYEVA